MKQLKKVTMALAMVMTLGAVVAPQANVSAATKSCSQTQNSCSFTKGKLCYKVNGNNTCTVTGLSSKGKNSTSCTIPQSVSYNGKTYKVTKVSANAFSNCSNLKNVNCSSKLKTAGNNCFGNASVNIASYK